MAEFMKTPRFLLLCLAAAFAASGAFAQDQPAATYQLISPSGFKDFSYRDEGVDETARIFDDQFQAWFVPAASKVLPAGQRLHLRILDIDMAGDIQPWRNNRYEPLRYIEFGHPPRMTLEYQIIDPAGGVLAEGREELVDASFDIRPPTIRQDEPFAYEFVMLERWLKSLIGSRNAGSAD